MHMKKFTALLLCLLCLLPAVGQKQQSLYEMMLADQQQIRQKPGTEQLMRQYMQQMCPGRDTVLALLFIPAACPRCEATIAPFVGLLRAIAPKEKLNAILLYDDTEAAIDYNARQQFGEDAVAVDTREAYTQIFSFNSFYPIGVYILRIDAARGRLITGGQLSYIGSSFVRDLLAERNPLPLHSYGEAATEAQQAAAPPQPEAPGVPLSYSPALPLRFGQQPVHLSLIQFPPTVQQDRLLLGDNLTETAFLLRLDSTRQAFDLTGRLTVDTLRRDDYIDLAPADKQAWQRGFRYMTLGASFFGDNEVGVSASVPMVFEEDGCVVLFNEPLVMRWRLTPFGRRPTTDIDADIVNPMHMEMHYITYPLGEQFIALQSCKFTYPDFMTDDSCKGTPLYDPRTDAFYDQPLPYMAQVDKRTGHVVQRFGQLEDVFRRTRLGYTFVLPVADTADSTFVYGNGFTGLLHMTAADTPQRTERTYEVFHLDSLPPAPVERLYDDDYKQIYYPHLYRCIIQATLDSRSIHCLVRYGTPDGSFMQQSAYEYVCLSRATGAVTARYRLAPESNDEKVLAYGLRRGEGKQRVFYIGRQDGTTYLKFMAPQP